MKFEWTLDKNDALTIQWALSIVTGLDGFHNKAEFTHACDLYKTVTRVLEGGFLD